MFSDGKDFTAKYYIMEKIMEDIVIWVDILLAALKYTAESVGASQGVFQGRQEYFKNSIRCCISTEARRVEARPRPL